MRLHCLTLFLIASLLLLTRPARATEVSSPAAGFKMTVDAPDAQVCVVWPKGLEAAPTCLGVDIPTLQAAAAANKAAIGVQVIRYEDHTVFMQVASQGRLKVADDTPLDDFFVGVEKGLRKAQAGASSFTLHGTAPSSRFDELRVSGARTARYVFDAPGSPNLAILGYVIFGPSSTVSLTFQTAAPHLSATRVFAEQALRTAVIAPVQSSANNDETPEYRAGKYFGSGLVSFAMVFGAAYAWLSSERRAGRTSDPAGRAKTAAKASWVLLLISVAFSAFGSVVGHETALTIALAATFLILFGMASGIYALTAIRAHGRKGILLPALAGIGASSVLCALALGMAAIVRK
jgi:hypothetical protein